MRLRRRPVVVTTGAVVVGTTETAGEKFQLVIIIA